jgi:hypothetical protein
VASDAAASESAPATTGRVALKGDATRVQLSSGAGTFSPGQELAPGVYEITAWFGEASLPAGTVSVQAGHTSTITCNASFLRCQAR